MKILCILASVVGCFCLTPLLAQMTFSGKEAEVWAQYELSVVVARVDRVAAGARYETGTHLITMTPLATLAGLFDPSLYPEVAVATWIGEMGTSIHRAPAPGVVVIAVIGKNEGNRVVLAENFSFMPDSCPLVVVTGLDDPRIIETLRKIRLARAATTKPATAPSAAPRAEP
jgi:hypothetical protein